MIVLKPIPHLELGAPQFEHRQRRVADQHVANLNHRAGGRHNLLQHVACRGGGRGPRPGWSRMGSAPSAWKKQGVFENSVCRMARKNK